MSKSSISKSLMLLTIAIGVALSGCAGDGRGGEAVSGPPGQGCGGEAFSFSLNIDGEAYDVATDTLQSYAAGRFWDGSSTDFRVVRSYERDGSGADFVAIALGTIEDVGEYPVYAEYTLNGGDSEVFFQASSDAKMRINTLEYSAEARVIDGGQFRDVRIVSGTIDGTFIVETSDATNAIPVSFEFCQDTRHTVP